MTRLSRVLAVSLGLFAGGAVVGALTGAAMAALVVALVDGVRPALDPDLLTIGAAFGAPLGAVLFPLAGWLLMRRVPLGRALLGTAVGTIAGGLVGWFVPVGPDVVARTLVAGVAGFVLAVFALRRSATRAPLSADLGAV
jgi:hypothetical protein